MDEKSVDPLANIHALARIIKPIWHDAEDKTMEDLLNMANCYAVQQRAADRALRVSFVYKKLNELSVAASKLTEMLDVLNDEIKSTLVDTLQAANETRRFKLSNDLDVKIDCSNEYTYDTDDISELEQLTYLLSRLSRATERVIIELPKNKSIKWNPKYHGNPKLNLAVNCAILLDGYGKEFSGGRDSLLFEVVATIWEYVTGGDSNEAYLERYVKEAAGIRRDHIDLGIWPVQD